ncbi:D-tyrosyl-tRNA(Tyr) deacylase [Teredinibacter turnerae T7901]|uniref:D-aminoacyl-tRNA deacylase n=1 Tax=Teredinibacter turnerae (strain ATCC 39867 / T7901) TaxID=377629 RepID=DTD_TERTT|nr:D-aminoacyl-tRNA deacylase [Teredinibacter turnerae]C5BPU7.1 RecName: Full=D-aminoacyl-tRNA deacylase; Short=DTD; AltName: Full=Gly-tRNA(Ala) deacylase [Teredinibacter turnerae T7901]ACR13038.1 D-tyrosyl-tRNA(Tyr) deacylase [Teredinibacter turnerae T7901]
MKVLIQRVTQAAVDVDSITIGQIDAGILALVGVEKQDNRETLGRMAQKLLKYRIFPDSEGKMNLSLTDTGGGLLVVSQFTLAADTRKGLRPSFSSSAPPDLARSLFDEFVAALRAQHPNVETGRFGADMKVRLINDGPVTFMLES